MRIALFCEPRDGLASRLARALAARGGEVVRVSLSQCAVATAAAWPLRIPGFADAPPDAAFVRTIPGGSFEQVTARLGVLHALRDLAVPVWNDARAIECCVDKSMTSFRLARAGLPTPATVTAESRDQAAVYVAEAAAMGRPLVLKPLFGSQGRGLRLLAAPGDLPPPEEVAGLYYLQDFVATPDGTWHDHRVLVSAGRAVAAMTRRGAGWITNIKQGASAAPLACTGTLAELAERAAACVGARYAGVDLIRAADGRLLVLEVNSMPAWSGLQGVTRFSITARLARDFLDEVRAAPARSAPLAS